MSDLIDREAAIADLIATWVPVGRLCNRNDCDVAARKIVSYLRSLPAAVPVEQSHRATIKSIAGVILDNGGATSGEYDDGVTIVRELQEAFDKVRAVPVVDTEKAAEAFNGEIGHGFSKDEARDSVRAILSAGYAGSVSTDDLRRAALYLEAENTPEAREIAKRLLAVTR